MTEPTAPGIEAWGVDDYIKNRLNTQQKYHSDKSGKAFSAYRRLNVFQILAAAAIPLLSIWASHPNTDYQFHVQLLIALLGALVSVCAGLQAFGQYHAQWLHHRAISEALKSEKMKFLTGCGDYARVKDHHDDRFCKLVARVEALLNDEHQQWQQMLKEGKKNEPTE